jgi:hypothetical protein
VFNDGNLLVALSNGASGSSFTELQCITGHSKSIDQDFEPCMLKYNEEQRLSIFLQNSHNLNNPVQEAAEESECCETIAENSDSEFNISTATLSPVDSRLSILQTKLYSLKPHPSMLLDNDVTLNDLDDDLSVSRDGKCQSKRMQLSKKLKQSLAANFKRSFVRGDSVLSSVLSPDYLKDSAS